ncbi:MAG: Flp family type IVb pilin [Phycisphaerales bacterium]|nr:Flp family type IVb pilin [Phycisphaerales bacterium]
MNGLRLKLARFLADESGPTATEYAVMLALMIVVCIATVTTMGQNLNNSVFGSVNACFGS